MAEFKLELLMQMVPKILDNQRRMREDIRKIKSRLERVERRLELRD